MAKYLQGDYTSFLVVYKILINEILWVEYTEEDRMNHFYHQIDVCHEILISSFLLIWIFSYLLTDPFHETVTSPFRESFRPYVMTDCQYIER